MIGLIHGRIYYNLLNWYRVLALLPGFKANRSFMEQMMGVKESLPADIVAGLAAATWRDRLADRLHLARTVVGLAGGLCRAGWTPTPLLCALGSGIGRAHARPEHQWRADELVAYYRRLESDLLPNWDAPLVNDFFAMIFYGLLRQLSTKWCGDSEGTLQNELLTGTRRHDQRGASGARTGDGGIGAWQCKRSVTLVFSPHWRAMIAARLTTPSRQQPELCCCLSRIS